MSSIRSYLRALPIVAPLLRTARRAICPNQFDYWAMHGRRFEETLQKITNKVDHPVFVKVGANDGVTGDPCGRLFIDNLKWTGVLIEPVPYLIDKLARNYSDRDRFVLEQVAIGKEPGKTQFYYVDESAKDTMPELPVHYDMLGSFDRQHIVNHLNGVLEPYIVAVEIEVQTLAEVLARNNVKRVDILQVDTEGYDWEVLKSLDFDSIRPNAIYIEHKHHSPDDSHSRDARLESRGYRVLDCGNDFFAEGIE